MKNKILINTLIETLSFGDKMFRTLRGIEPIISDMGVPRFTSGRNSAIFDVMYKGERYALKCYTQPLPHNRELCEFIHTLPHHLIIQPDIYNEELWVGDGYTDVMLYKWVSGRTFDWWIRKALYDKSPEKIHALAQKFISLMLEMIEGGWRHGDIKPENILVLDGGELILIDCDSIYSPSLPPRTSMGTPHYIHPARKDAYDSHIDDFAIALILTSLEALRRAPSLYAGEAMVTLRSESSQEVIRDLFADSKPLTALYDAMCSDDYKILNLKELLQDVQRTDNTQK